MISQYHPAVFGPARGNIRANRIMKSRSRSFVQAALQETKAPPKYRSGEQSQPFVAACSVQTSQPIYLPSIQAIEPA
jgi:hypothetical protein